MVRKNNVKKLVATAMLSAIIVVIQLLLSSFNVAGFPITLTLVPIIVGATMYGKSTGAILGAVFGAVVCAGVILGTDPLGAVMFHEKPVLTLFICMLKGVAAGFVSGWIFELFKKWNKTNIGLLVSSIICPIINTGLLLIVMIGFFDSVVTKYAIENTPFSSAMSLILSGILVGNFLPELVVNIVVSPTISKIVSRLNR